MIWANSSNFRLTSLSFFSCTKTASFWRANSVLSALIYEVEISCYCCVLDKKAGWFMGQLKGIHMFIGAFSNFGSDNQNTQVHITSIHFINFLTGWPWAKLIFYIIMQRIMFSMKSKAIQLVCYLKFRVSRNLTAFQKQKDFPTFHKYALPQFAALMFSLRIALSLPPASRMSLLQIKHKMPKQYQVSRG